MVNSKISIVSMTEMIRLLSQLFDRAATCNSFGKDNLQNIIRLRMQKTQSASLLIKTTGRLDCHSVEVLGSAVCLRSQTFINGDDCLPGFKEVECKLGGYAVICKAYRKAITLYHIYYGYQVDDVYSLDGFLSKYYRNSRLTSSLVDKYKRRLESDGFVFISNHDSSTNRTVSFYAQKQEVSI